MIVGLGTTALGQTLQIDSLRSDFDKMYGSDVLLNNGKKYFPESKPVIGIPFWKSGDAFSADLTVSGKTFKDQRIKYNLYKQEFLLIYTNSNGQHGQIVLNTAAIDSINTGRYKFILNKYPEIKQPFVQLIFQGHLSCVIGWSKELKCNTMGANAGYQYSNDFHNYYLDYRGTVYRFSNSVSFLRIFSKNERIPIRKYISSNRIRFKKIDDNTLRKLISFCNETIF